MPQGEGGGPKTADGKARSSRNAVKHAIRSPHPFIIEELESPEEWEQFKLGIMKSWEPVGRYEQELAERIAFHLRRLRRSAFHETLQLNRQVEQTEYELQQSDADEDDDDDDAEQKPWPEDRARTAFLGSGCGSTQIPFPLMRHIDRILRYETHVSENPPFGPSTSSKSVRRIAGVNAPARPRRLQLSDQPPPAPSFHRSLPAAADQPEHCRCRTRASRPQPRPPRR